MELGRGPTTHMFPVLYILAGSQDILNKKHRENVGPCTVHIVITNDMETVALYNAYCVHVHVQYIAQCIFMHMAPGPLHRCEVYSWNQLPHSSTAALIKEYMYY